MAEPRKRPPRPWTMPWRGTMILMPVPEAVGEGSEAEVRRVMAEEWRLGILPLVCGGRNKKGEDGRMNKAHNNECC